MLGYESLVQAIKSMPSTSVYFGQMFPNTPLSPAPERFQRQVSFSFFPFWANGLMYGVSRDIAQKLVSPEVMGTVWKPSSSYHFPEDDRSIGLALVRGRVDVQHYLYIPGTFTYCSREFSCSHYHHAIAFHVGFGLSGDGPDLFIKKKELLSGFHRNLVECNKHYGPNPAGENLFIKVNGNETFEATRMADVMVEGCYKVDPDGEEFTKYWRDLHELSSRELEEDYSCAESFYLSNNPEVVNLIESGEYSSGRDHYVHVGWKNDSMHFFCPEGCESGRECKRTCDVEQMEEKYLKSYPDVADAVNKGVYKSGLEHFTKYSNGRSFSCYDRYFDISGGQNECKEIFGEFILYASSIVSQWPVHGKKEEVNESPGQCKAVVFIEGRNHEWMDFVLRVHRHYTGPDWMFYLIGTPDVAKVWRKKYEGPMVTIKEIPERFGDLSVYPDQINDFTTSNFLWKEVIECEYVLISQADALLLRHGVEDFFEYSYAGAPIFPESFPSNDWRQLSAKNISAGGCGGLSFRRRSYMIKALEGCPFPKTHEDVWFSSCMQEFDASLPHPTIANRFSTGSRCDVDLPLGVHKLWHNCGARSCAKSILTSRLFRDVSSELVSPSQPCASGEILYRSEYADVDKAIQQGIFESSWTHYSQIGKAERRGYHCIPSLDGSRFQSLLLQALQVR